jgi:hypothetical protein
LSVIRNLKHLKSSNEIYYSGLPVNASDDNPVYISIIENSYRELTKLIARYTRTVIIRVDLIPGDDANPSEIDIKEFCRSFKRKLETKYKSEVAYQWVKEYGRKDYNEGVHWHFWIGVKNADDSQPHTQSKDMQNIILESWEKRAGFSERNQKTGWFYLQRKDLTIDARLHQQKLISQGGKGLLINMTKLQTRTNNKDVALGGVIDECFYALSYLAKVYSKVRTHRSKDLKTYSQSNITTRSLSSSRKVIVEEALKTIHKHLAKKLRPISVKNYRTLPDNVRKTLSKDFLEKYGL